MDAYEKTESTLEERAYQLAKRLLEKYNNPYNLLLHSDSNSNLEDSYTVLITLLCAEILEHDEQLEILVIIDEMKLLDGNR